MLRQLTWTQFLELIAACELDPLGSERADLRFAILASVVAGSAGAKGVDGKPYSPVHFIRALNPEEEGEEAAKEKPVQTVQQMENHLLGWIAAANKIHEESKVGAGSRQRGG